MALRAPVRSFRSPVRRPLPVQPDSSALNLSLQLSQLLHELEQIKNGHKQEIDAYLTKCKADIEAYIVRMRAVATKGDKGDLPIAGVHYAVPTLEEILAGIPTPKDGKDANESAIIARVLSTVRDELATPEEIADMALSMIVVPKGEKGDSPSADAIIELLVQRIKNEKLLKPEHIDGLGTTLQTLKRQGGGYVHGGGDTVLAGTGISITKNSAGRKVITNTSAGGITQLTATETPDGTNAVFTFAAATAQPSFLLVDNVWMKPTTKKGTVNWTWSAGTLKATLTVAPTDEIVGIV